MPTAPKTLRVYANPYVHLDHEGRPAGALPTDPSHTPGRREWVGATLSAKNPVTRTDATGKKITDHDLTFEFSSDAVTVPNTAYYRHAINSGELVAADAASYLAAGGSSAGFADPSKVLADSKQAAIKSHVDNYGEEPAATRAHSFGPMKASAKPALKETV